MWIVKVALNRPYTFIVLGLLILILSPVAILKTPTDIFPNIDIPVVAVAWTFTGMNPEELEGRLTSGVDPYLQVVTAQTIELLNERNAIEILRRRMEASVLLIKGLGGGWDTSKLPPLRSLH